VNKHQPGLRRRDAIEEAVNRSDSPGQVSWPTREPEEEPAFDLRALLGLARRQKWTIAVTVGLGLGLGALYVSQVERQYTAAALVVVDPSTAEALGAANGLNDALGANTVVATEIEIIRSQSVQLLAAEMLDLPISPVFEDRPSRIRSLLRAVGLGDDAAGADPGEMEWSDLPQVARIGWSQELESTLRVGQRGTTNAIEIAATTPIPAESAAFANAVATAYLEVQVQAKIDTWELELTYLRDRVNSLLADIEANQSELDALVVDVIERVGTPEARQALSIYREQLAVLEDDEAGLANLQAALVAGNYQRLAELVESENPGYVVTRSAFAAQLANETDQDRRAAIQTELRALDAEIRDIALAQATTIQDAINGQEQDVNNLEADLRARVTEQDLPPDVEVEVFQAQRESQQLVALYDSFLTRLRAAEQEGGAAAIPDSRIISEAVPPTEPSYPSVRSTMIMALLLSAAAGFGLALLRENWIGGIGSVEQMEQAFGIPVLAGVPRYKGNASPDRVIVVEPLSSYAEAIRRIRLGVESSMGSESMKVVVTSALPGEGKTTVALSLARSLAKAGRSTILVDGDLRHPAVRQHTDARTRSGVIDYLIGEREGSHLIMAREQSTGLTLALGSEPSSDATDSLLLSERFAKLVEFASREYECVLFDSPPIGLVVDAHVLTREYADAAIFVTKAESTGRKTVQSALHDLQMHATIPIFAVLNQIPGLGSYYGKYSEYYR
jgi:capsular exopolysaccharide synthesis family protein